MTRDTCVVRLDSTGAQAPPAAPRTESSAATDPAPGAERAARSISFMFDDRETTEARIRRFIQHDLIPHIHQQTAPVRLRALRLPGEPIPPREAIAQLRDQGEPIELGAPLGRAWSTIWLHVSGTVPAKWADRKSTRLNSSHVAISYAVFCLKKKTTTEGNATAATRHAATR